MIDLPHATLKSPNFKWKRLINSTFDSLLKRSKYRLLEQLHMISKSLYNFYMTIGRNYQHLIFYYGVHEMGFMIVNNKKNMYLR